MKPYLTLVFILFSAIFCCAQQRAQFGNLPSGAGAQDNILRVQPAFNQFFVHLKSTQTKVDVSKALGSPFEDENFSKGKLYDNTELIGDFYLRYNAYDDEIELKQTLLPEEPVQSLVKNSTFKAIYKNDNYSYKAYTNAKGQLVTGYLRLLTKGNYALYHKLQAVFVPATVPVNPQTRPTPSRFAQFETYYMSLNGIDQIMEVPTQQSKFIALFDKPIQASLKKHMKENKIKLKEEADLILLFDYLNKS